MSYKIKKIQNQNREPITTRELDNLEGSDQQVQDAPGYIRHPSQSLEPSPLLQLRGDLSTLRSADPELAAHPLRL